MNGRLIFSKLVKGYKNLQQQPTTSVSSFTSIAGFDKPVEITGSVVVKKPEEIQSFLLEGIEIPEFRTKRVSTAGLETDEEKIKLVYPLIPEKPAKDEPIFAYANI